MEAAAVSLQHHRGALPLPASLPPPHHRSSLPIPVPQTTRRPCVCSSSSKPPAACLTLTERSDHAFPPAAAHYSGRAATGYAAALADACVRAGTLRRASCDARALLLRRQSSSQVEEENAGHTMEARVAALVRMLVGKGKAGMVAEVMAEFAAICDRLLPRPAPRAQYHGYYSNLQVPAAPHCSVQ